MSEGVDYSWARPDPAGLAAAGKRFAVRYIGTPRSGKNLTAAEVDRLRAAGLDLVAVYQTTAAFMTTSDGAAAARAAATDAERCGMPPGRPIYFALDTNPGSLSAGQWLGVERFLAGAASELTLDGTGVYGGHLAVERLCPTHAQWGWQTYAWSGGRWSSRAQLQQYRNGVTLAGGLVDLCRSTVPDFGQWGVSAPAATPPPPPKEIEMKVIDCAGRPALSVGADGIQRINGAQRAALVKIGVPVQLVDQAVSDALWSLHRSFAADVDEAAIAASVVSALGDDPDPDVSAAVEAAVRRVFADAGSEG